MTKTTIVKESGHFERNPVNAKRPTREPSVKSDVEVPLRAALGMMGLVFVGFIGISLYKEQMPSLSNVGLALMISVVVGILVYFWRMNWAASVIWAIEEVVRTDIDKDGFTGEPSRPILINKGNARVKTDPARVWQEGFYDFVNHMYQNGTAHHSARGKFSEQQIMAYRQYMVDLGIARWKNSKQHQSGLELVLDQFAAEDLLERTPWNDVDKKAIKMR